MNRKDFIDYVEPLLTSKDGFLIKALDDENARNKRRAPKKRWQQEKVDRAAERQWDTLITSIYEKVRADKGRSLRDAWIEHIEQEGFIESLNDSIAEIEFD